jgi:hypothetical protein
MEKRRPTYDLDAIKQAIGSVGEVRHRLDEHAPVDAEDCLDDRRDRTPTQRRRATPTS